MDEFNQLLQQDRYSEALDLLSELVQNEEITQEEYNSACVVFSNAYNLYTAQENIVDIKKAKIKKSEELLEQFL